MAVLQQLSFSGESRASSTGGRGVMGMRCNEHAQLAEPKVTAQNQMSVRLDSLNASHLEVAMFAMFGQLSR